jgi:hypothetical protein
VHRSGPQHQGARGQHPSQPQGRRRGHDKPASCLCISPSLLLCATPTRTRHTDNTCV